MRNVSELFKESCNELLCESQVKILVSRKQNTSTIVTLTDSDFIEDTVQITSQATSSSSFMIGGVCSAKLKFRLTREGIEALQKQSLLVKGICLKLFLWHKVDDDNQDETDLTKNKNGSENTSGKCNLGVFYISGVDNNDYYCDIEAYDAMLSFDKSVNARQLLYLQENKKTAKAWVEYIVSQCNTSYGSFGFKLDSDLINTNIQVCISADSKVESYREALGYLTTLMCGFATFDENGDLYIRAFKYTPEELGVSHQKLLDGKFDGQVSAITGFYSSVAGFDYESTGTIVGNANAVDIYISENPWLRGIQEYNVGSMNSTILGALQATSSALLTKKFFGCDITIANMPYLELGDCISVNRVVISPNGESQDIVDTNIIVCDITHRVGISMQVKSNSTTGTTSSKSSGKTGSQAKVKSDASEDTRLDDLINAFSGTKYETRIVQIPIEWEFTSTDSMKPYTGGMRVVTRSTGRFNQTTREQIDLSGTSYTQESEWIELGGAASGYDIAGVFDDTKYDNAGFNIRTNSFAVSSYFEDLPSEISGVELSIDFTSSRRLSGFGAFNDDHYLYVSTTGQDGEDLPTRESENPTVGRSTARYVYGMIDVNVSYDNDNYLVMSKLTDKKTGNNVSLDANYTSLIASGDPSSTVAISSLGFPPEVSTSLGYHGVQHNPEGIVILDNPATFDASYNLTLDSTLLKSGYASTTRVITSSSGTASATYRGEGRFTQLFNYLIQVHGDVRDYIGYDTRAGYDLLVAFYNLPKFITMTYTAVKEIPADIDAVIDAIEGKQLDLTQITQRVSKINTLINLLSVNIENNAEYIGRVSDQARENSSDISRLEKLILACQEQCNSFEEEASNRLDALEDAVKPIPSMQEKIEELDNRVSVLEGGDLNVSNFYLVDEADNKLTGNPLYYVNGDTNTTMYYPYRSSSYNRMFAKIDGMPAGSLVQFQRRTSPTGSFSNLGTAGTDTKSTYFTAVNNNTLGVKAQVTYGQSSGETDIIEVTGYPYLRCTGSAVSNADGTKTVTTTPQGGAVAISGLGLGHYEYKFAYGTASSSTSAELGTLKDWSTDNTVTFTPGSEEVGNVANPYIRCYVRDGIEVYNPNGVR